MGNLKYEVPFVIVILKERTLKCITGSHHP